MSYPPTDPKAHLYVSRALHESGLSCAAFRLLGALRYHCGRKGSCYPGVRELAQSCHLDKSTVLRAIAELERSQWVTVERSQRRANVYVLTVPHMRTVAGIETVPPFRTVADGETVPPMRTAVRIDGANCSADADRSVRIHGTEGDKYSEGGGTATSQDQASGAETDEAWKERLKREWPGLDIEAELTKVVRKLQGWGRELEQVYFEREWLPRCSKTYKPRRRVSVPVEPSPLATAEHREPNVFSAEILKIGGPSLAKAVGSGAPA